MLYSISISSKLQLKVYVIFYAIHDIISNNKNVIQYYLLYRAMQMQQSEQPTSKKFVGQSFESEEFEELQGSESFEKDTIQLKIGKLVTNLNSMYNSSKSTIKQLATNVVYNVKHSSCPFINRKQIILKQNQEPAFLLGQKFTYGTREQFYQAFHNVIWICYRYAHDGQKVGDVGWGCMIRVCQMVLAQALKRSQPKKHNSQIIKQFSSSTSALFSFDKICLQGKIIGRWTSSAEILIALQDLLKQQSIFKLKIEVYNAMTSIEDVQKEENYPLLMVVNNRICPYTIEQRMRDHLYSVLSHKCSIGMISGIGGEALYIAGFHEDQLITLDPHYVQPENEGEKLYYNQRPRGVPLQKLVPCAGFCFFFSSANEHKQWVQDFAQSWYHHRPNVVFQCQQSYCEKVYKGRHLDRKCSNNDSGEFEVLE